MKKITAALILIVFSVTLTSCSQAVEPTPTPYPTSTAIVDSSQNAISSENIKLNLYFYTNTNNNFTREIRTIKREGNEPLAELALNELFKGPTTTNGAVPLANNISLKKLEISQDVVNVYLNDQAFDGLNSIDQVKVKFAIYYTLKDIQGIQYVNVYVGDSEKGYNYKPFGTLKKYNIDDYKSEFLGGVASTQQIVQKRNVTLYFSDKNGEYILPEVRTITISDNSYVISVVNELINGPVDKTAMKGILTSDCGITSANIDTTNGVRTLSLKFKNLPALANISGLKSENIAYASIIYTVTGFLVDIDRVIIYSNNEIVYSQNTAVRSQYHTRSTYSKYLGTQVSLYFSDSTKKQLYKVLRTVVNSEAQDPIKILAQLFKGPSSNETKSAWPILPKGISSKDIISTEIKGETLYLNLSENFYAKMKENSGNEFITTFAIVNTLCEIPGVKNVQFLMNGQKRDSLVDKIKISEPIYPNYGIINFTY